MTTRLTNIDQRIDREQVERLIREAKIEAYRHAAQICRGPNTSYSKEYLRGCRDCATVIKSIAQELSNE